MSFFNIEYLNMDTFNSEMRWVETLGKYYNTCFQLSIYYGDREYGYMNAAFHDLDKIDIWDFSVEVDLTMRMRGFQCVERHTVYENAMLVTTSKFRRFYKKATPV